ncbi:histidinol-phosphate aminotransferase [Luminiphilus syltensis NOR5-1B]|uniref:Histidinol-phosphate aminotransferase n=1 Tax=Luminiphilus syltensis NOR5-1B TaxID=565045 RepID=B8KRT0_9GAMM|nr:histidinol-phosphate transaminase [Luminiphilus syltensis]EED36183.1 histidinol-phosphate aminotransferase [Luminiphilus syltensis NOR5-1B]
MSKFWNDTIRSLVPYVPGEQPKVSNLVKLNTNEHPLPPSKSVMEAIAAVQADDLRRYPDPESLNLRGAIASVESLSVGEVFVGNGSDEVLGLIFQGFLAGSDPLTVPAISYGFYPVWARLNGLQINPIPLRDDFSLDLEGFSKSSGPLLFANPNAPTGLSVSMAEIEWLLENNTDRLVVVDEAYFGFGSETAAPLIARYDNLLITRTLSKSHSLAGLRVGYALGDSTLIDGLVRIKDSFNSYPVDAIAQAAAAAAIRDVDWLTEASAVVVENREALAGALVERGFEVTASTANFLFVRHKNGGGKALFNRLRGEGLIVRRWDSESIQDWLRVTVGSTRQHKVLLDAIDRSLEAG